MSISLILQSITTAFSLGLGCGTCCGTSMGVFLTSYIATHAKNIKKTSIALLLFVLGKLSAITSLCVTASIIGNAFIDKNGYIGNINVKKVMQMGVILVGVVLIIIWLKEHMKEKSHNDCNKCSSKSNEKACDSINNKDMQKWPPIILGFIQGMMPCAPLIMIISYSIAMPILGAIIIAIAFCIANTISPALLLVLISGILSRKMYEEIPKYIDYVKLSCYVMFVVMAFFVF